MCRVQGFGFRFSKFGVRVMRSGWGSGEVRLLVESLLHLIWHVRRICYLSKFMRTSWLSLLPKVD